MKTNINISLKSNSISIKEQIIEINNPLSFRWSYIFDLIKEEVKDLEKKYIIKLNLVKNTREKLYFNLVYIDGFKGIFNEPFLGVGFSPAKDSKDIGCLIIPTGTGAKFGGYAGDANPLAKLFAKKYKYLLTHPNVVNGSVLSDISTNTIYLEGFLLDLFLLGNIYCGLYTM